MKLLLILASFSAYAQTQNPITQPKSILHYMDKYKNPNTAGNQQVAAPKKTVATNASDTSESDQSNYLKQAKDSSVDMLIAASTKYKAGQITKDQYIQVALQVSQMADYTNKYKGNVTEAAKVAVEKMPIIAAEKVESKSLSEAVKMAASPSVATETTASVNASADEKSSTTSTVVDPATKKIISCSKYAEESGCKPGKYRSNMGSGGYYDLQDPVITLTKNHFYTLAGANVSFEWTVIAESGVSCELKDVDSGKVIQKDFGAGSGSWTSSSIPSANHSPAASYMVLCRYPSGQFSYQYAQVYHVKEGSPWLKK